MKAAEQKKLPREFYTRNLILVARELLGKIFVKKTGRRILSGRIVEVEAYHGDYDEASHAFIGKTKRNEVMFKEGGHLYIYFTYGTHFCANVVAGREGKGMAVLIRAVEPLHGIKQMSMNRFGKLVLSVKETLNLTSGPGKLCQAFALNRKHNGMDLTGNEIYILNQPKIDRKKIGVSKRIGITKSVDLPWRFFIKGNPFVSKR